MKNRIKGTYSDSNAIVVRGVCNINLVAKLFLMCHVTRRIKNRNRINLSYVARCQNSVVSLFFALKDEKSCVTDDVDKKKAKRRFENWGHIMLFLFPRINQCNTSSLAQS